MFGGGRGIRPQALLDPAPMVAGLRAAERHWRSLSNPSLLSIEIEPNLSAELYFYGGGRGIRTLDAVARKPPFQGGAIDH